VFVLHLEVKKVSLKQIEGGNAGNGFIGSQKPG
jgi:hypothetical protein